ncbi:hypothetical protein [Cellulomonas oligotrophica]|uniref:Uncharacterized protein n=1 Tax=Cellulomonas oligotrophica TaxID=931536 RepID=A0A7Y9FJI4_9CELL|nr:hypothetical protein [Cellulomonas oligotrophica]NYD87196.1 hypothetical protein [Cellulomonas oligotrophica]GIG33976.1 hypothetical protein Col01nite_31350 [Cellulomonas oligotrophica]
MVAAFEVEHTTSIYSGIVRMLDLALSGDPDSVPDLYLVAPDDRENDVRAQLTRPAFGPVANLRLRYLPYSQLAEHRGAIGRFGSGLRRLNEIMRRLG